MNRESEKEYHTIVTGNERQKAHYINPLHNTAASSTAAIIITFYTNNYDDEDVWANYTLIS